MLVIIEGPDFSGKTTISTLAEDLLNANSTLKIVNSSTCLLQGFVSKLVYQAQLRRWPSVLRDFIFIGAITADALFWKDHNSFILIQQSYINRMLAFRKANQRHLGYLWLNLIKKIQPKPQLSFFLSASFESRRKRFVSTRFEDSRDQSRFNNLADTQRQMDKILEENCKKDNYFYLDTEMSSPFQCAQLIYQKIREYA
jgi:thymidylate kinase